MLVDGHLEPRPISEVVDKQLHGHVVAFDPGHVRGRLPRDHGLVRGAARSDLRGGARFRPAGACHCRAQPLHPRSRRPAREGAHGCACNQARVSPSRAGSPIQRRAAPEIDVARACPESAPPIADADRTSSRSLDRHARSPGRGRSHVGRRRRGARHRRRRAHLRPRGATERPSHRELPRRPRGVFVSNTAGFVDAGWDGHLTLELSNVATLPIALYPGMKIGQISFLRMTTPGRPPLRQ